MLIHSRLYTGSLHVKSVILRDGVFQRPFHDLEGNIVKLVLHENVFMRVGDVPGFVIEKFSPIVKLMRVENCVPSAYVPPKAPCRNIVCSAERRKKIHIFGAVAFSIV